MTEQAAAAAEAARDPLEEEEERSAGRRSVSRLGISRTLSISPPPAAATGCGSGRSSLTSSWAAAALPAARGKIENSKCY